MTEGINIPGFDSSFLTEPEVSALLMTKGVPMVSYDPIVEDIISMSRDEVARISLDTVTDYIVMLGQYLIYLDGQFAVHNYIHRKISTQYEELMAEFERDEKGRNIAERRAGVHSSYPDMKKLADQVKESELEIGLIKDRNKTILEFLNALKHKKEVLMLEVENMYRSLDS